METAKLFGPVAHTPVRLPRALRVDGREVRSRRRGRAIVPEPVPDSWAWLDALAGELDEDFVEGCWARRDSRSSKADAVI